MDLKEIIQSQYHASFEMIKQAIVRCPNSLWANATHKNQFWHIAYHTLFYTHLYLQHTEADFSPWEKHHEHYPHMGRLPWPPHDEPQIGKPYTKDEVLEYLALCQTEVDQVVTTLDLHAPSGFDWLPFSKIELQFYNIRHLQHHTGELCERLWTDEGIEVGWVGMGPKE